MLTRDDQGTVTDEAGNFRFLSERKFCEITRQRETCFVCLLAPSSESQEHIIPNWIIRLCGLSNQTIGLGNDNRVSYPRYKIPCCERCNQSLRATFEDKISRAIKGGISAVKILHESEPTLLLRWLNLLYFKTHYKDLFLRLNSDYREGDERIGDIYDWGLMNLPHTLFRASMFNINIESRNIGSLVVIALKNPNWAGTWDYRDDFRTGTVYVRIQDIVIIGVINDGGITANSMIGRFCVEDGAYVAQTLEMLTDYQVFNYGIKSKPDYVQICDSVRNYTGIRIDLPKEIDVKLMSPPLRHKILWQHLENYADLPMDDGVTIRSGQDRLLAGTVSLALNPRPQAMPRSEDILSLLRGTKDTAVFFGLEPT